MKTIALFFMSLVTLASCNCTKQTMDKNLTADADKPQKTIPVLKYEESTRGFSRTITVENGSVKVNRRKLGTSEEQKAKTISSDDLTELVALYNALNVEDLANLKAPTVAHQHDGAPIAVFSITVDDKTYNSVSFDGGNPPAEIKAIVNKMLKISDQK